LLNLSDYVDSTIEKSISEKVEKCPDPNAKLEFSIKSTIINTSGSETMSMMSGMQGADVMSIDSGPDTEFKFADIDKESVRAGGFSNMDKIRIKRAGSN